MTVILKSPRRKDQYDYRRIVEALVEQNRTVVAVELRRGGHYCDVLMVALPHGWTLDPGTIRRGMEAGAAGLAASGRRPRVDITESWAVIEKVPIGAALVVADRLDTLIERHAIRPEDTVRKPAKPHPPPTGIILHRGRGNAAAARHRLMLDWARSEWPGELVVEIDRPPWARRRHLRLLLPDGWRATPDLAHWLGEALPTVGRSPSPVKVHWQPAAIKVEIAMASDAHWLARMLVAIVRAFAARREGAVPAAP